MAQASATLLHDEAKDPAMTDLNLRAFASEPLTPVEREQHPLHRQKASYFVYAPSDT